MAANSTEPFKPPVEIINRRASHEYIFLAEFEAGIMLTGTEIKSVRNGSANMNDAYCYFEGNELYVRNMYIAEYEQGHQYNHEPRRNRKLLLHRSELKKILRQVTEKGKTIIPYRMFINERGLAKLVIVVAQGKKTYDKRESIREKDQQRELARMKKWK